MLSLLPGTVVPEASTAVETRALTVGLTGGIGREEGGPPKLLPDTSGSAHQAPEPGPPGVADPEAGVGAPPAARPEESHVDEEGEAPPSGAASGSGADSDAGDAPPAGTPEDRSFRRVVAQQLRSSWMSPAAVSVLMPLCAAAHAADGEFPVVFGTWGMLALGGAMCFDVASRYIAFASSQRLSYMKRALPALSLMTMSTGWSMYGLGATVPITSHSTAEGFAALGGLVAAVNLFGYSWLNSSAAKGVHTEKCMGIPGCGTVRRLLGSALFMGVWAFSMATTPILSSAVATTPAAQVGTSLGGVVVLKFFLRILWVRLDGRRAAKVTTSLTPHTWKAAMADDAATESATASSLLLFENAVVMTEKLLMWQAPTWGSFIAAVVFSEVVEIASRCFVLFAFAAVQSKYSSAQQGLNEMVLVAVGPGGGDLSGAQKDAPRVLGEVVAASVATGSDAPPSVGGDIEAPGLIGAGEQVNNTPELIDDPTAAHDQNKAHRSSTPRNNFAEELPETVKDFANDSTDARREEAVKTLERTGGLHGEVESAPHGAVPAAPPPAQHEGREGKPGTGNVIVTKSLMPPPLTAPAERKTLIRRASAFGGHVAARTVGVSPDTVTKAKLAQVKRTCEIVQYVEQQSELSVHVSLSMAYFAVAVMTASLHGTGAKTVAMALVRSFPGLGANWRPDDAGAGETGKSVDFAALPLTTLCRGLIAIGVALLGDRLCLHAEERVGVDSIRLVQAQVGCEQTPSKVQYALGQLAGLGACTLGLLIAREI